MTRQTEVQAAVRFKGEIAEIIAKMAKDDDRSHAYIVKKLIEERLGQLYPEQLATQ